MGLFIVLIIFGLQYIATKNGYGMWLIIMISCLSLPLSLFLINSSGIWLGIASVLLYCNLFATILYLFHRVVLKSENSIEK